MEGDRAKGSTALFPHTRPHPQHASQTQTLRGPHCPGPPAAFSVPAAEVHLLSMLAGSIHSHRRTPLNSLLPAGLTAAFLKEDSSSQGA